MSVPPLPPVDPSRQAIGSHRLCYSEAYVKEYAIAYARMVLGLHPEPCYVCPFCNQPAVGWSQCDVNAGRRMDYGTMVYHCREAAD